MILTNETTRPLLHHLHTKRAGHMRLIAIAFDGNVLGCIESLVRTAAIRALHVGLCRALVTSD